MYHDASELSQYTCEYCLQNDFYKEDKMYCLFPITSENF